VAGCRDNVLGYVTEREFLSVMACAGQSAVLIRLNCCMLETIVCSVSVVKLFLIYRRNRTDATVCFTTVRCQSQLYT
jgi:hypothetical protein